MFARLGFLAPPAAVGGLTAFMREDGTGSVLREDGFRVFREEAEILAPVIAFVRAASNGAAGAGSVGVTLNSVAAGNILVVGVSMYEYGFDGIPNTITSSPSLTWTRQATSPDSDPGADAAATATIWTSSAVATPGTHTITVAGEDGAYLHATAAEFSGVNTTTPLEATGGTASTSDAPVSGSATATAAGRLALVCYVQSSSNTGTANGLDLPTNYTNLGVQRNHQATIGHSFDYRLLTASGSTSASWGTLNDAESWAGTIALLRPAT